MNPIIGILTDFGNDFAVASIKGVLLTELPRATLIDIDHSIEKFNVASAAFVIDQVYKFFPQPTYFLCIVDPGVGSQRNEIYVRKGNYHFVGPDNGLFSPLWAQHDVEAYLIDGSYFKPRSHTFHGRDLFAPALAAIAQGKIEFLTPVNPKKLIELPKKTMTNITYIDSFGNIKTDYQWLAHQQLPKAVQCLIKNQTLVIPFVTTFANVPEGTVIAYRGSNNTIEIAVNRANAAQKLTLRVGDLISLNPLF